MRVEWKKFQMVLDVDIKAIENRRIMFLGDSEKKSLLVG